MVLSALQLRLPSLRQAYVLERFLEGMQKDLPFLHY